MIRINLLKNISEKRKKHRNIAGPVIRVTGGLICATILIAGGIWGYKRYETTHIKVLPQADPVVKKDLAPSSYKGMAVVEDVVKEVNDSRLKLRESGILDLPYDQLSFSEKVNYELFFTKNVCEMISRIIPGGIGLKSLELDNFQTVYAVGVGSTRTIIEQMLTSLRREKVTLLPPPYSFVKPAGKEGFRFAFSCKTRYGLNLTDPMIDGSLARLPALESIPDLIKKFDSIAVNNNIALTKKPVQVSVEKVGNYYRYIYQWAGTATYKDFVKFVFNISDSRIMSAFKSCSLIAQTSAVIKIESQIVVTAKD